MALIVSRDYGKIPAMQDPNCLFCKIIKREIPCDFIYENKDVFVFLDIKPLHPGHVLVLPKNHFRNIFDIEDKDLSEVILVVKKMAKAVKEAVKADGINIAVNNDEAAGQLVFHSHFHIMPRYFNDGFKHWGGTPYKEGESKIILEKIKSAL